MAGLVRLLLETGATPDRHWEIGRPWTRKSPLQIAVDWGENSIIKDLLFAGAEINDACLHAELTPLSSAILNKNMEVVRLLIDKGADINYPNVNNSSALMSAIKSGILGTINWLLDY
ncbi:ankyrin repeat protein, partial [Stipitochalara longipes BDJ]